MHSGVSYLWNLWIFFSCIEEKIVKNRVHIVFNGRLSVIFKLKCDFLGKVIKVLWQIDELKILRYQSWNVSIMRRNYLSSILPIKFISIIILWIMGSGDHHSSDAFVSQNAEGHHRGANNLVIQKYLNAIMFENGSWNMSESLRKVSTVITNSDSLFFALFLSKLLKKI